MLKNVVIDIRRSKRVFEDAKVIHGQILAHQAMTWDLRESTVVFDVIEDPDSISSVGLIESNDFVAMTGCSNC